MDKVFRQGIPEDADAIFDVMACAFKIDESNPKYAKLKKEAKEHSEFYRVLELDGQVVSIVRILHHPMQIGCATIIKGDVGEVSTHPDFQGRGLMTELMRDCVRWMRENGYDISRLGGLVHFYSRFGYVPFPRRTIEFPLKPVRGGGRVQAPDEVLPPVGPSPGTLRHYRPETDKTWKTWLTWHFNNNRTGAPTPGDEPPEPVPLAPSEPETEEQLRSEPWEFVCERNGRVYGYISAHENPDFEKYLQAKVEIGNAAFDLSEPRVAGILVNHILHIALTRGADCVVARLPFDPKVYDSLTSDNVRFRTVELHASFASNMIRIVSLESLLRNIKPELDLRLSLAGGAPWTGTVGITVAKERVRLDVGSESVAIAKERSASLETGLGQADMMRLVLGMCSAREMLGADTDPKLLATLDILFPHQPTACGLWG
ncbi:MAG: GNAT family N-acetyltransferase [Planctomycetes bacterium]|nr:GNAT family N-acetyltransferase [Planctomycetota bacterium]